MTEITSRNMDINYAEKEPGEKESASYWWIPTSSKLLAEAESRILAKLKLPYKTEYVNVGPVVGGEDGEVWTISMNEESKNVPLVLLHGFGAGIGFWALNFDSLAKDRPVYAIDHLGFGRSSRPKFSSDPEAIEKEFVTAVEEWRKKMGLEKFVLVGHSFGGYVSTSYSISYPDRVKHLLLLDPWGFPEKSVSGTDNVPWWVKAVATALRPFNPFSILRVAGPKGQSLLNWARGDLVRRFEELNQDGDLRFGEYIYHCNVQNPSGETAFSNMIEGLGRAKRPMVERIPKIDSKVPVTVVIGSASPIRRINEETWHEKRQKGGYVKVHNLEGIGHHIYSDAKEKFHEVVQEIYSSLGKVTGKI